MYNFHLFLAHYDAAKLEREGAMRRIHAAFGSKSVTVDEFNRHDTRAWEAERTARELCCKFARLEIVYTDDCKVYVVVVADKYSELESAVFSVCRRLTEAVEGGHRSGVCGV